VPAIVQTAREESDEMYLRDRLLKVHSFSVILLGNRKHNHFILYKYNIFKTAKMFFKAGKGALQSVFGSDRRFWSQSMKSALGVIGVAGFPCQLSPMKNKTALPIPAVDFTKVAPSLKNIFNQNINIYVTSDTFFVTKFREIFQQTKLRHNTAAESKRWLGGPDMKYWPQQLNFAVFCETQRCGISREIFASTGLALPPQIRAFLRSGEVSGILYQLGGIQNISALPGDLTFNKSDNYNDVASYKRICDEFGINSSSDLRFTHGKEHGLGSVYIGVTGHGSMRTGTAYPGGFYKSSDEGGAASKGNRLSFIEPDAVAQ